jgi:hypothetical protein
MFITMRVIASRAVTSAYLGRRLIAPAIFVAGGSTGGPSRLNVLDVRTSARQKRPPEESSGGD